VRHQTSEITEGDQIIAQADMNMVVVSIDYKGVFNPQFLVKEGDPDERQRTEWEFSGGAGQYP